jgi:hypothetical protein
MHRQEDHLIGMWYAEAGKYNVLPIDSRGTLKFAEERPQIAAERTKYLYYPGTQVVPGHAAAKVLNRAHSVTAEVDIPKGGAEGVLFSMGGNDGGFTFYVKDGKLRYAYNYVAQDRFDVESKSPVPAGHHFLSFEFKPTGKADPAKGKGAPGTLRLLVDAKEVGRGDLPVTIPLQLGLGGRRGGRGRSRLAHHTALRAAVPVHGHHRAGAGGHERRGGRGQGRQVPGAAGAAVGRSRSAASRAAERTNPFSTRAGGLPTSRGRSPLGETTEKGLYVVASRVSPWTPRGRYRSVSTVISSDCGVSPANSWTAPTIRSASAAADWDVPPTSKASRRLTVKNAP